MTRASCPRLFEVEAMRDGRLSGADRTSFVSHMKLCPVCALEAQALDALAEAFRANTEDADELRVRRARTRLLAAFDGSLVAQERRGYLRRHRLGLAAIVALAAGLFIFLRMRPAVELAQPAHAPSIVIRADGAALYSQHTEGNRDTIALERGALWIHVTRGPARGALVVVLPDGELEDTGTVFTVTAADGHTTRVAVEEGSVVLRIRGRAPVVLGAGETWMADAEPAASASSSSSPVPPAPTLRERPSPTAKGASVPRAPAPSVPELLPDPSNDFRVAMAAFDRGDSREAAARFASFLDKHPRDARAEDAAYLRIFALERSGDGSGMKEAAREYLRRYPAGFRRAEVENLSR